MAAQCHRAAQGIPRAEARPDRGENLRPHPSLGEPSPLSLSTNAASLKSVCSLGRGLQFNYPWLSGVDSPEARPGCHNQSCVNSIGDPCWNSSGTHFTDMNLALQTEFATQWNYPWCAY